MVKKIFRMPGYIGLAGLAVIAAVMLVLAGFSYSHASELGENIGSDAGRAVGKALGSFEGITKGREAGIEDGKAEGLKAIDTEAEAAALVSDVGRLEVLAATVSIQNLNQVGDTYAALYLLRGEAVFTVDLDQAEISRDGGKITILLPDLEVDTYIDAAEIDKIADYQRLFFNGNAEAGFEQYINSLKEIKKVSSDSIAGCEELEKQAKEAACRQVGLLARQIRGNEIQVEFKSER